MAALTEARSTNEREGRLLEVPVAANARVFQGGLVVANGTGFAAPGSAAANLTALGRAEVSVDNTGGANGAKTVTVKRGVFKFENKAGDLVTQALMGKDCSIEDDQTVRATAAGSSRAGKVVGLDADGVWVEVL
jgi:hypothetical protein